MAFLRFSFVYLIAGAFAIVKASTEPENKISVSGSAFSSSSSADEDPPSKSLPIDSKAAVEFAILSKAVLVKTPVSGVPGVGQYLNYLSGGPSVVAAKLAKRPFVPGVTYPILAKTTDVSSFSCWDVQLSGYYADIDNRCQIFRYCDVNGRETSFLCPNTTVFNQVLLVCDHWYNVICERSVNVAEWANSHMIGPIPIQRPPSQPCHPVINCLIDPCDKRFARCPRYPNAHCYSHCCKAYWFERNLVEVTGHCDIPVHVSGAPSDG
ncbi:hypothetical protein BV898_11535 [Hypsibius exemplaris]|uniref:Chitin-binding type-2 domain-containing protein n=1 Tax=Hypsibius exemplaris TaxID=2072580 RepID=A0A1W0WGH5_HYPEX|nr:hypothetical protein BV898_11535 [Hypsibius exemplaris]